MVIQVEWRPRPEMMTLHSSNWPMTARLEDFVSAIFTVVKVCLIWSMAEKGVIKT